MALIGGMLLAPTAWAGTPQGHDRFPSTDAQQAVVEIIEVGDYQCPFCGRVQSTLERIAQEYGGQVKLTFIHNPLSFHKQAKPAAIAAVAAQRQGRFWEMHDTLFDNQRKLDPADLTRYAAEIGLDARRFEADLDDPQIADFVDDNQRLAVAVSAIGTPSFFINGKNLRGAQPFERFKEIIDAEIEASSNARLSGARWIEARTKENNADLYAYVFEGQAPPKMPSRITKPVDRTVYRVSVNPKVDPVLGSDQALVTLVLFAEYQCPFCAKLWPSISELVKKYPGTLRVVFKHNPLSFHERAEPAAVAAACAFEQGNDAFWKLSDVLFRNQRNLEDADLERYAQEAGVVMRRWRACVEGGQVADKVAADQELAAKVTARGTPNAFINGRKLTGAKPIEEFEALIDEELKKAKALKLAERMTGQALYEKIVEDGKVFEPLEEKVNTFKVDATTPTLGSPAARIQVTIFSDFQCPFSARLVKPLAELRQHYGEDIAITYKYFPLSFHKRARPAALAAQCAHDQGKFWPMHDRLFDNQKALEDEDLQRYAQEIGLEMVSFGVCLEGQKHDALIEAHMAEGRDANVRGTPTIYINGRKFNSPSGYNLAAFTAVIDKYILKK